jgi:hypothetical protein
MAKRTFKNTDTNTRVWMGITDTRSDLPGDDKNPPRSREGRTLELEPGEEVDLDMPDDFEDSWLKEAKVGAAVKRSKSAAADDTAAKES